MSENLQDIDDLFRKAADAHDDMPSANVWANIDKQLDKKKVVLISRKYNKLKWAAAAMLIFSVGMAMYTWNTRVRNRELVRQTEQQKKTRIKKQGNDPVQDYPSGQAAANQSADSDAAKMKTPTPGQQQ